MELLQFLQGISQPIVQFVTSVQNADPSTVAVVGSIIIIFITIASTALFGFAGIQYILLLGYAVVAYAIAPQFEGARGDFFLNLGSEFIGAIIGGFILSEFTKKMMVEDGEKWIYAVILSVVILLILAFGAVPLNDNFVMSVRTDILGAFLVFTLLNRNVLTELSARERRERERERLNESLYRDIRQEELKRLDAELEKFKQVKAEWQLLIVIRSPHMAGMRSHLHYLKNSFPDLLEFKTLRHEESKNGIQRFFVVQKCPTLDDFTLKITGQSEYVKLVQRWQAELHDMINHWGKKAHEMEVQAQRVRQDDLQTAELFLGVSEVYIDLSNDLRQWVQRYLT